MKQYKICLLGDFAVGKTSLVRRFVEGRFDERYLSTIGVTISRRAVDLEEQQVNLILWDLAGGEEYSGVQANYLSGARGALIVCDLTRADTLVPLPGYAQQFFAINPSASVVFLGNKLDLADQHEISSIDLESICRPLQGPVYLTSAKTGEMVAEAMHTLAEMIKKNK